MLIGVQGLFYSALIIRKCSTFFVFVIIVAFEGWSWHSDSFVLLVVDDLEGVGVVKAVGSADEAPLLADELVVVLGLVLRLRPSEGGHSDVVGIHGPGHRVDEGRLTLIHEAVHFIRVHLDFLSSVNHFPILFTWHNLLDAFLPVFLFIFIHSSKVYSLFVLKGLNFKPIPDSFAQRFIVVSALLVPLFR